MKLTIQPRHRDYFYEERSKLPWGNTHYIAGQPKNRHLRNRKCMAMSHDSFRTLKYLSFAFFILCMTIISRETLANEQALSGELQLIADDGAKQSALHLQSKADIHIKGMHAQVTLTQSFTNQTDSWVEGTYVFPLPQDSAVNAMQMVIGERKITAEIREREEAKKIYNQAKKTGKKTTLIEQERPNLFTQSIANIGPGETIKITLEYLQPVRYDMGKLSLRFPMTITERYIPGKVMHDPIPGAVNNEQDFLAEEFIAINNQGWGTDQVPDASRITPPQTSHNNFISLAIHLNAGMALSSVESASHPLKVKLNPDNTYQITTKDTMVVMNKDFELVWKPEASNAPKAAVFHETMDGESFVQLMLLPPYIETNRATADNADATLARELILIVDTSGSMQGQSIIQAKKSVSLALKQLQTSDSFNVIEFNSNHRSLFSQPVEANHENINRALSFVNQLNADGGTEMAPALSAALQTQSRQDLLRQIVFITDGAVGNEQQLFSLIHQHLGASRLFTVGIGSAPNSHFMEKAAQFGRGTFTHISTVSQVNERMSELFRKLDSPVMSGIDVVWPKGWNIEAYPTRIPDLYLGEPLLITAKMSPQMIGDETITIKGAIIGKNWQRELHLPPAKTVYIKHEAVLNGQDKAIIPSYWARFKIDFLQDQNTLDNNQMNLKDQILPVALKYQLMSAYTSFIAVEETPSRSPEESLGIDKVANSNPAGQTSKQISYPQTATPAELNLLIGLLTLLLAFIITQCMSNKTLRKVV